MSTKNQTQINQEFIEAARANDVHRAIGLLEQGSEMEARTNYGQTALIVAVRNGHIELTIRLLEKGADLETRTDYGWTALMFATRYGHIELTIQLLEKGADLEAKDKEGQTSLMVAARNRHIELTIQLLEKGAELEAKNKYGHTALMFACISGENANVLAFLEKGADLEDIDKDGRTALVLASSNGYADIALALIAHGADSKKLPSEDAFHGFTPLQACAAGGLLPKLMELLQDPVPRALPADNHQSLIELAVEYQQSGAAGILQSQLAKRAIDDLLDGTGENFNQAEAGKKEQIVSFGSPKSQGSKTMTPQAQSRINQEFIESVRANDVHRALGLLEQGADPDEKDKMGKTALMFAAQNGHMELSIQLLGKGADLEVKDNYGWTALLFATRYRRVDLVSQLLENRANTEARDNDGWTSLMVAASIGNNAIALALLQKGANLEAKENEGQTALVLAAQNGHIELTLWLLEKGADLEAEEKNELTALMLASSNGYADVALALIAHGSDSGKLPSEDAFHGFTPLQACAAGGFLPKLQALLEDPAPRNLASEQPLALIGIALEYKQSNAAGILPAHLAKKTIDDLLDGTAKISINLSRAKRENCQIRPLQI